ncbi:MAG: hypothetical protein OHK005_14670 [Candidatus Methylacidiphilales bacterium]
MPLLAEDLENRLAQAAQEDRLAHAYLLNGQNLDELEAVFHLVAQRLLGTSQNNHPDLYMVRPESKSRRITVEQIRELERSLSLKAVQAPLKVAGILAADRMCIGQAEAANAFLKTLEEPPSHTVIFLTTTAPDLLLPTIKSRCLSVPFASREQGTDPLPPGWLDRWLAPDRNPTLTAYRRAAMLIEFWNEMRENIEQTVKASAGDEPEEVVEARATGEFQLRRDQMLGTLARGLWDRRGPGQETNAARAVDALEELRYALSRNVETGLATERACLVMEGCL